MTFLAVLLVVVLAILAGIATGLAVFALRTARRVEALLPPQGAFSEIDGARLHYVDKGKGPAIVMIHGLGGQVRHFTHSLVPRLSDDFRVIAVDRPGCGYSTRASGASARLTAQAATIAKLIRSLNLKLPIVVGHSLGGAVALALALDHPDCVGGLALIAPLTHPNETVPEVFKGLAVASPLVRRLVAWTLAIPRTISKSKATLAIVFGPDPVPPDFGTAGGALLALRPRAYVAASTDFMAVNEDLPGMVSRYGTLTLPVGILFGRGDRLLDPAANGTAMDGKIRGLELTLTEGGHMLPLTAPEMTAGWIRRQAARVS